MSNVVDLWFYLPEVLPLSTHAMDAGENKIFIGSPGPVTVPVDPTLLLVKGDGVYLISTGWPRLPADPKQPAAGSFRVYAHGFGPGSEAALASTPIGGQHFVEHLVLTDTSDGHDGTGDIQLQYEISKYAELDGWMVITFRRDGFEISYRRDNPN
ncbi:hypothetical protein ACWDYH_37815 [Nocardia goodfellowii]